MERTASRLTLWLGILVILALLVSSFGGTVGAAAAYQANLSKIDSGVLSPSPDGDVAGSPASGDAPNADATIASNLVTAMIKLKDLASPAWRTAGHDYVVESLQGVATRTQEAIAQFVRFRGGVVRHQFWLTNTLLVSADAATLRDIAQYPIVERIYPNYPITLPPETIGHPEPAQGPYEWNIERVRAPEAWALGVLGDGVRVCITDTGVDVAHPDLAGRYLTLDPADPYYPGGWIELDGDANIVPSTPHDTYGHGTHVSGTIAGDSYDGTAIGVAPGATLMQALVIPGGYATTAQLIGGMEWCVNPYDRFGTPTGLPAHVQSMSWGEPDDVPHPEFLDPIKNSILAGIIPVVATGNEGEGLGRTPGTIWGSFGIGATDVFDQVPYWSSGLVVNWPNPPSDWPFFGTYPATYLKPDFSAPGDNIKSTLPGGSYGWWSGTSMATPHVAGTVALMVQASGFSISVEQAYLNLQSSVVDFGLPGQDTRYGYGRLDTYEAVLLSLNRNTGVEGAVYESGTSMPLPDVRVTALELGASVRTDANGTFRMGLPEGTYNLSFTKFGYYAFQTQVVVQLFNGTLAGYVEDVNGTAIAGAQVDVVQANLTLYTDSSGYYEASLKAGTYTVTASAAGLVPATQAVDVPENDTAWANFTLYPNIPAILTGTVYNASDSSPVPGALVWAEGPATYQAITDGNGTYMISILMTDAGLYEIGAFKGGMWPQHYNVTVTPGSVTVADFYDLPSNASDVAIYQDFMGELGTLLSANGNTVHEFPDADAMALKWSLSAFPVVYWSGFSDLNYTTHPTAATFLDILSIADAVGVSIVFADSFDGWPYGIELLSLYTGDPAGRGFDYNRGDVYFTIAADHPIFQGVGNVGDKVYVINNTNPPEGDGDFTWFWGYTGTLLANVSADSANLTGDGIAVRDRAGGTEWLLLGSLAPQFWTHVSNDWTPAAKQIAVNSVEFGRSHSWVTGLATTLASVRTPTSQPPARGSAALIPIPTAFVNLTVFLDKMPSGFVSGNVTDTAGMPVEGVGVYAAGTPVDTMTDLNGQYTMELPIGDYTIVAKKFGYRTGSAMASVLENVTTYLDFVLVPQRRAGVMYDDSGDPIKTVLEATDEFAVMQFADDWDALIAAVPGLDVVILSGRPMASVFPSEQQFNQLLSAADGSGVGVMFLDNVYGYGSPYMYAAPYGISLLAQFRGDPAVRIEPTYCQGNLFEEITVRHGITRGFAVGDRPQLTNDTCSPFSAFSGFSGTTVGRLWSGYGSPSYLWGDNLAFRVTPGGSRWALLGGYAPVFGYGSFWAPAMKQIFVNAAIWASTQPLQLTIDPPTGPVGTFVVFAGSGAPASASLFVLFDDGVLGLISANGTGGFGGNLTVPEAVYGEHAVVVTTLDENYAGEDAFFVVPSLVLSPDSGPPESAVSVSGHGYPALGFVELDFASISVGGTLAGPDGSFSTTMLVPSARGGDYVVTGIVYGTGAVATASFRLIEEVILGVQASVGTLHFRGEIVNLFVLVTAEGQLASASVMATLWYPNGTSEDLAPSEVAVGLYMATYTLPGNAPSGTYALVAQASVSETYRMGGGAGLASFLVSPTLTSQNAMITSIEGGVAQIQTDTGAILVDLSAVGAEVTSIQGTLATISTSIGMLQANVASLDAKITAVQGSIATVQTTLGSLQVSLTALDAKITAVQGTLATISTSIGTMQADLAALDGKVTTIQGNMATVSTGLGNVQVSLDDLDAKITSVQGDIATIQTRLGDQSTQISTLQTTGGNVAMSAAALAAIFSAIAAVVSVLSWRMVRKPKEP